jgi:hypothetical protein
MAEGFADDKASDFDEKGHQANKSQTKALKSQAKQRDQELDDAYKSGLKEGKGSGSSHPYFKPLSNVGSTVSSGPAGQIVLLSMGGTIAIVAVAKVAGAPGAPASIFKVALGASFATIALLAVGEASPELAKAFALLILLTTFLRFGGPFFTAIEKATGAPASGSVASSATTATGSTIGTGSARRAI